jgi:hypothetical protein
VPIVTDFKDLEDVKRAVVDYVKEHDICSSDEVLDGIGASTRARVQATHEALNALVTSSGVLFGQPDATYDGWQQDHDREWDTRWEHLTFRG